MATPIALLDAEIEHSEDDLSQKYVIDQSVCVGAILYTAQPSDDDDENYSIGTRVMVNTDHLLRNKIGHIRFIGQTHFRQGMWYGIELDEPVGESIL